MNNNKWVGSFSISPTNLTLTNIQFKNETVLVKLNMTLNSNFIRIKFSNLYGNIPLTIKKACIYNDNSDNPEYSPILFNGKPEVIIPEKKEIFSDSLKYNSSVDRDCWIGFYVENFTELSTGNFSFQSYYISEKDNILDELNNNRNILYKSEYKNHIIPFITSVEASTDSNCFSLIIFGDSGITAGWYRYLVKRFQENNINNTAVLSHEINGNRLLHHCPDQLKGLYGASGLSRFEKDVLNQNGIKFLMLFPGINDLISSVETREISSLNGNDIINALKFCIAMAKERDIKVIGCTIPPIYGCKHYSEKLENIRKSINRWICTSEDFDSVADFDNLLCSPEEPEKLKKSFDNGEYFYINETGIETMAECVDLKIFTEK
jgi:hypothetical protein